MAYAQLARGEYHGERVCFFKVYRIILECALWFILQVAYLTLLGGNDAADITRRILKHCLSLQLAMGFNWEGRKNKEPFKSLKLKEVIFGRLIVQLINLCDF